MNARRSANREYRDLRRDGAIHQPRSWRLHYGRESRIAQAVPLHFALVRKLKR
jgi:hypothetical protein